MIRATFTLFLALAVGPNCRAGVILIDAFQTPGGQKATDFSSDGAAITSVLGGQQVLGGSREIFVSKTGQLGKGIIPVTASVGNVGSDCFIFDQNGTNPSGSAGLIYDGTADGLFDPTGLGSLNVVIGGDGAGLTFSDVFVTGKGLTLTTSLFDAATGLKFSHSMLLPPGSLGDLFFSYVDFGGPSAMRIGAIEILIDGTSAAGSDLSFGKVSMASTVPEPSTFGLLAFGAVGVLGHAVRYAKRKDSRSSEISASRRLSM